MGATPQGSFLRADSFWTSETNSEEWPSHEAVAPLSADIVIVGGGIMGTALSYWLTKENIRVVVVDESARPTGASVKNAGIVGVGPITDYFATVRQLGREAAQGLTQLSILNQSLLRDVCAVEGFECNAAQIGLLSLALRSAELADMRYSCDMMREDGVDASLLTPAGCAAVLGAELSAEVIGGLWTGEDHVLHPVRLLHGLSHAAARRGAVFLRDQLVENLHPRKVGRWVVTGRKLAITCQTVIIANNVGALALIPRLNRCMSTEEDVVQIGEVEHGLHSVAFATADLGIFGRSIGTNRLLLGGGQQSGIESFKAAAGRIFAHIGVSAIERSWSGRFLRTRDECPLVGGTAVLPGLWMCLGFCGNGLPFSLSATKLLATAIIASDLDGIPAYLRPDRFLASD
jgi:glycine/D-amino acid oxidase-like deaminating enzyme